LNNYYKLNQEAKGGEYSKEKLKQEYQQGIDEENRLRKINNGI
jgi:hypothetical protein